jgi:hypothetical protein
LSKCRSDDAVIWPEPASDAPTVSMWKHFMSAVLTAYDILRKAQGVTERLHLMKDIEAKNRWILNAKGQPKDRFSEGTCGLSNKMTTSPGGVDS